MKIDKVESKALKAKTTTSKKGKAKTIISQFYFRVRVDGVWFDLIDARSNFASIPEDLTGVFSSERSKELLPRLFVACGLEVPESVTKASEEAKAKREAREAKAKAKREEMYNSGRDFVDAVYRDKAVKAWDKLEEEFGNN